MGTRERSLQNKPAFPDYLDTNSRGVWAGWYSVGDKEVAREAATKGTHIDLAVKFLSARTGLGIDEARKLFKDEVHSWVLHLLMRNQVFKATHILKNMGLEPTSEMQSVFMETSCRELRDNVGNHLHKLRRMDEGAAESWALLRNIEGHPDVLHSLQEKHISINARLVMGQSHEWKTRIGTDLFFRTFDFSLESFVDSSLAWRLLLKSDANLLKQWISAYFGRTISIEICENNIDMQTIDRLNGLFSNLGITQEMIDLIAMSDELDVDERTQNVILNELSRYGVFDGDDSSDLIRLLRRLLDTNNLENVGQVITNKCATVNLMRFYELVIKYCFERGFYSVANLCTRDLIFSSDFLERVNSPWLNVIVDVRKFGRDFTNKEALGDNVFEVARLLSTQDDNGDLGRYFSRSPLVLLALVLFTKDTGGVYQVLSNRASIKLKGYEIDGAILRTCTKDLPVFASACGQSQPERCPRIYDLLEVHGGLGGDFWSNPGHILHFNSPELARKYGRDKRVNYLYFVRRGRPNYACRKFAAPLLLESDVAVSKVTRLAIRNFLAPDVTNSCVAFLEMAGLCSGALRMYLGTANVIYKSGLLTVEEIRDLLINAEVNSRGVYACLEAAVMRGIHLSAGSDDAELMGALKDHDLVVKFASAHNFGLPELFLRYCAERDLWLAFLIYVQVFKYPVGLCCRLVQCFASQALVEHLSHCLSLELPPDEPRSQLMGERDSRKYFLSRIGVRKSPDGGGSASETSLTSHSSYGSMSSSSSGDFLESDTLDYKTDLLQVLIRCHNSTDPPKALLHAARYYKSPFLAVLATSYEPDSLVTNWATWLAVSCDIEESSWSYDGVTLTPEAALNLLKCVLEKSFLKTLRNSFDIFLPDNPLKLIVEFLYDCAASLNFDRDSAAEKLQLFHKQLKHSRSNSFVIEAAAANDMSYFTNKLWIQKTSVFMIATALGHAFKSRHDQIRFLDVIRGVRLVDYFFIEPPDFDVLLNVLRYTSDNDCDIDLNLSVIYDRNKFASEVTRCIDDLVQKKLYAEALRIAELLGVPTDEIVCTQMKEQKSWSECDGVFSEMHVAAPTAVKFYLDWAEHMDFNLEKYEVLRLAYNWARRHKLVDLVEVEKKMWLAYFHLDDRLKKIDPAHMDEGVVLYSEVLKELEDVKVGEVALSEAEVKYWEKTVEDLLNFGDLYTVLRLERIFGCGNTDLEIIKLCLSLVEEILLPHQLTAHQRLLLMKRANVRNVSARRRTYVSRVSSISSVTQSPNTSSFYLHVTDNVVTPLDDTLALLEILIENLKNGAQLALKLLMTYRISINIQKKYREVLKARKPIEMVQEALLTDCDNKLQVVSDFVYVYNLSKEEVADFICDEIIKAATEYSKSKIDICFLWDMNVDSDFNLVLQLFPDNCTVLGLKLYSHASSLYKSHLESEAGGSNVTVLVLVIELLIRSHDCFTADCNMEGISVVLKKCQVIISQLIASQNWKLIVRLLTGIARYSEMNYVFQILRVNDQFELLLRKGSRKDAGLKLALLEYLRKFCPDDLELYKIVALHFFLFSEIAQLWEQEAETVVRRMITLAKLDMQNDKLNVEGEAFVLLRNNDDNKRQLHKIMSNYKHAAEYHLYGEKLTKAMNAAKQAELLALQLSLLKDLPSNATSKCLFNLSNPQLTSLITSELSFPQTSILVDAYGYQVDWASVLFERYLVADNSVYFTNFLSAFPLTEALVHDISRKFLSTRSIGVTLVKNMKFVLDKLSSVHAKYRIASELGFSDIVEDLLDSHQMAYLKDTVWKKGYKSCTD